MALPKPELLITKYRSDKSGSRLREACAKDTARTNHRGKRAASHATLPNRQGDIRVIAALIRGVVYRLSERLITVLLPK